MWKAYAIWQRPEEKLTLVSCSNLEQPKAMEQSDKVKALVEAGLGRLQVMKLRLARVKLDCAGPVQWRGGAKNSHPFIVICPALTFLPSKVRW